MSLLLYSPHALFSSFFAVVLLAGCLCKLLWDLFLSPLARLHLPGPSHTAVGSYWFHLHALRFDKVHAIEGLFQRYGPIVRVSSNRVAFSDPSTVREIYSNSDFIKGPYYKMKQFGSVPNIFSTSDPSLHAQFRRWYAPAFRGDNLRRASRAFAGELVALVARIRRDCQNGDPCDVISLFKLLTLDMLGIAVLGADFNQIASRKDHPFKTHSDDWILDKALVTFLPSWAYKFLRLLPVARLQNIFCADAAMCASVSDLYDNADLENDPNKRANLLTTCKEYRDSHGEPAPKSLVVGQAAIFMIGGMDATSSALSFVHYELARSQRIWTSLRTELATVSACERTDIDVLRSLPYLNALLREILRVYCPSGLYLERIVPPQGAFLGGYHIPGGTIVGGQTLGPLVDPRLFPDPTSVMPERWVRPGGGGSGHWIDREDVAHAMNVWVPFGQGARPCPGRPLAEIQLLLIVAAVASNFRMWLDPRTTPESMKLIDLGVLRPQAGRCFLHFEYNPLVSST